ncbi:MAG: efflux RND transporter permease subunit [Cyanobacteria bacterium P01_H01_bin.15]
MSFHVSAWSIKNPVPTIVLFLVLSLVGFFSFLGLGVDNTPNIDVSFVSVTVTQRGAGPAELETQVTKKIEDAVAGIDNLEEILSTVTDGRSVTTIEFTLGSDADRATNDVRNAVSQIRQDLPPDIEEPIVRRLEFAGGAIATYAVSSPNRSVEELSDLVDRQISRRLLSVKGVAQVNRLGGLDRAIRIDLDPQRLQAYGITATQVNDQVKDLNINLSGGRSEVGGTEQNVRTLGSAQTVSDLRRYPIVLVNGDTVPLANLGSVTDSSEEARQSAFLGQEPVVGFSILRSTGSTLVDVFEGVEVAVAELQETLPEDIEISLIFDRATAIRGSYEGTVLALAAGFILTTLTVWVFLRDWRATLITAVALPLSILPTFWVMSLLGYTLNGMTLLALALAMGNLVDDAICMIENIDQHLQMGKSSFQAALDGAKEIGLAVVATTATVAAVFLPVAFMGGIPGQFFQPFGVTVAVSTMFSTLVATTMTPMLSAILLNPSGSAFTSTHSGRPGPYARVLSWGLRHRFLTVIFAIAFFIGSLQLVPFIPQGLFSEGDTGVSVVTVEVPPGSTLADVDRTVLEASQMLSEHPAVDKVLANVGSENLNEALLYVKFVPKGERDLHQREFEDVMREPLKQVPGARISFRSQGPGGSAKALSVVLRSDNPKALTEVASNLENQMREVPGLVDVTSSQSLVKPEILIEPRFERAADLGVSVQSIARTASLALIGDADSSLAKFDLADRQIPIRVQIAPEYRSDLETLKTLRVRSQSGELVPLGSVVDLRLGSGPAEIERADRNRKVSLDANLDGLSLGQALTKVRQLPALQNLPPDVKEQPAGDAEIMRDIFSRFLGALATGILCIYGILVLLYNNFLYPLSILSPLPLSVGGALLGLMIAQKELGLFALIGIVLLMGLVTKNAILLVDFALAGMREGKTRRSAIIQAGTSRLRPILMTSISTMSGMLPIALELGADGEVRSPMAIAVIGGFSTSTLLTLVVVPVIFSYIYGFWQGIKRRLLGKPQPQRKAAEKEMAPLR